MMVPLTRTEAGAADAVAPVTVTKADKCPVCGMFVSKYPDFVAQIIYADGSYAVFDGAKDMFKYLFDIQRYHPGKERSGIAAIYVTDYYSMTLIDGRTAWYVVGSDIFGPMGRELIPLQQEAEAQDFIKDHAGKTLLRFEQVTPELIHSLE
jgi:nitrous oxide reductase accessory protein NosL